MKLVQYKDIRADQKFYDPTNKRWYRQAWGHLSESISEDGATMTGQLKDFGPHDMVEIPDPE